MDQLILRPGERRQAVLDLLRSANRCASLSLFRCDDSRVLDEIVAASRRNVEVRVLITPRARGWKKRLGTMVTLLQGVGVGVHQYDGPWPKYHAKYLVVDDEVALVSSMNLTRKCFEVTCDFMLKTRSPELVSGLATLFNFDWHTPGSTPPKLTDRLIIGPEEARSRLIALLERARKRIRIIDHRVSHPDVLVAIARSSLAGVRVDILGRGEVGALESHGKLILIDNDVAIFGSASLSRPGLDVRREVAVVIDDVDTVEALSRFFDETFAGNAGRLGLSGPRAADPDEDDDED